MANPRVQELEAALREAKRQERRLLGILQELEKANAGLARANRSLDRQVERLIGQVEELNERLKTLQAQLSQVRGFGGSAVHPNTPSGQIPPYLKPDGDPQGRGKKRPGRPEGHPGAARKRPSEIHRTEHHGLKCCPACGEVVTALKDSRGRMVVRIRVIEDAPPGGAENTEHRIGQFYCRNCQCRVEPAVTAALPGGRIALAVLVRTAIQHYLHGIAISKVAAMLWQEHTFRMTEGGLVLAWQALARYLTDEYAAIHEAVLKAGALNADESGWRVLAQRAWLWCFCTPQEVLYVIDRSRGADVVLMVLGENFGGTLIRDFYSVYNVCEAAEVQYCLAHLLRELKTTGLRYGPAAPREYLVFAQRTTDLLREAIRFVARPNLTPERRRAARNRFEERLVQIVEGAYREPEVLRLRKRLLKSGHGLFTFVTNPRVDPTNNRAERNIRPAVVCRKNSYGNRSPAGADTQAVLMSVFRTFHVRGLDVSTASIQAVTQVLEREHRQKYLPNTS